MATNPTFKRITIRPIKTTESVVSVEYDSLYTELPSRVVYNVTAGKTETIDITYPNGHPVIRGIEYRNYIVDWPQGILVPQAFESTASITDLTLSANEVVEESPAGVSIGRLFATGGAPSYTYEILPSADSDKFEIINTDEIVTTSVPCQFTEGPYAITARATDVNAKTIDKVFNIEVTAGFYESTKSTSFDGSTEYATVPFSSGLDSDDRSVFFWFNSDFVANNSIILAKAKTGQGREEWKVQTRTNGRLRLYVYQNSTTFKIYEITRNLLQGNWHHVGFTYRQSSDEFKIYLDGQEINPNRRRNNSMTGIAKQENTLFSFGCSFNSASSASSLYEGLIDEVSVWSDVLLNTEVFELYNTGAPNNLRQHSRYDALVSWWKMGEGDTAPTILDSKDTNHALMYNMDDTNFVDLTPTNIPPQDFSLSASVVDETALTETVVGTFSAVGGETPITYQLLTTGTSFRIDQDSLVVDHSLDGNSGQVTLDVRASSSSGAFIDKTFQVNVTENPAITDIVLLENIIEEGDPAGTVVASILPVGGTAPVVFSIDQDPTNSFVIDGTDLKLSREAEFTGTPLDVTIRASDTKTREYSKAFSISVIVPPYSSSKSIRFTAPDKYMRISNSSSLSLTTEFTASLWIKFDSIDNNRVIFGKYDTTGGNKGFKLSMNSNGAVFIFLSEDGTADTDIQGHSSNFVAGVWYHLVISFAPNTKKYYIDGVQQLSNTVTSVSSIFDTTADLVFGSGLSNNNPSGTTNCLIDEASLYDRALTDIEVSEIYNSGTPKNLQDLTTEPNLTNWWKMGEEGTFSLVPDEVGNNDGDLIATDANSVVEDAP